MGNCLTIEETVVDLAKKHNASALIINSHTSTIDKHTSTIKELIETQLKYVGQHVLIKDKCRAWEGTYSKDGFFIQITMINTKKVSKNELENWVEENVNVEAAKKFRKLYMPCYWFGSSAGSTLRYRFHENTLELEYKQTVEQMWDSAIEIVALVKIPESTHSIYRVFKTTDEWTAESAIWQSPNQCLKGEFVKSLTPDLVPIYVTDETDSEADEEATTGLPIAVVLEHILSQENTLVWKPTVVSV
jgi:hypothetical protein